MNAKPTLELLLPSLISDRTPRATQPLEILYPLTDARGQSARTLPAAKLAAPIDPNFYFKYSPVTTRSHKQYGTKGEA
jgi:hypothetical protein